MGILRSLLSILHPVRTAKRKVKRAVIPRPIRQVQRAKNQIVHPLSSAEGKIFGAVDKAITPKRRKR
jgi:hypothetical protein